MAAYVDAWHTIACPPLPRVLKVTPKRRSHIRARLSGASLNEWCDVMRRIAASKFCTGQIRPTDDRREPFMATLDWVIKHPDVRITVLEGKFDNRGQSISTPTPIPSAEATATFLAELQKTTP